MRHLICLPTLALAVALPAQGDHFTSSPFGYENVEGATSVDLIGKEALLRFQQIDATNLGSKANRNRFYLRRDGVLADNTAYGPRTLDMEFICAESDLGNASTTFDNNYVAGTMAVVVTRKMVSLPDWTQAPAIPPQGETAAWTIFFDNIWSYAGKNAAGTDMLWEVKCYANDKAGNGYPMDADPVVQTSVKSASAGLGTGCTTVGQTRFMGSTVDITNFGTKFVLDLGVSRAEPLQPAAMLMGVTANSQSIGWCTNLEIVPLVVVALPNTDASGNSTLTIDPVAYNAGLIGGHFMGQGITLDPNQVGGVSLGDGRDTVVPADPSPNPQCLHLWSLDPTSSTSTSGIQKGGIIAHTNHT